MISPCRLWVICVAPTASKASPNVYAFNGDRICASQRTDAMCQSATSPPIIRSSRPRRRAPSMHGTGVPAFLGVGRRARRAFPRCDPVLQRGSGCAKPRTRRGEKRTPPARRGHQVQRPGEGIALLDGSHYGAFEAGSARAKFHHRSRLRTRSRNQPPAAPLKPWACRCQPSRSGRPPYASTTRVPTSSLAGTSPLVNGNTGGLVATE